MRYEAKFKLSVVKCAEETNNSEAGRRFGVSEKLVRDWRKQKSDLQEMPTKKCANRGLSCKWPELEIEIETWILEQRQSGLIVTRNAIRIHARRVARSKGIDNFRGTVGWLDRFMQRKNLSLRCSTKLAQKLPADLDDKVTNFFSYIIKARKQNQYDLINIGNMDETPVWFDMPTSRTVDASGKKTIQVKTTGHEKSRFTVVLSCLANGEKLKPMIIFKRKTIPKLTFPPGVVIHAQDSGWMDAAGIILWAKKVWGTRPGGLLRKRSLLVWDSFRAHLGDEVKRHLKTEHNTDMAVIPGGLTSIVQPLDVCLNKPFKDRMREKWAMWMIDGEKSFTPAGNVRAAPLDLITTWVLDSWNDLSDQIIQRSFKKCGISNALDGTEDDLLWEDDAVDQVDPFEYESDIYDPEITADEMHELFNNEEEEDVDVEN